MKPLRLLQVEDTEDDAALVHLALTRAGYDVLARRVDTADALRRELYESEWDLVIADYTMPGFSGTKALAIVRELQVRYPHNPLFRQIEAEILDKYFQDYAASLKASEQLLSLAQAGAVFRSDVAERVARANIAKQSLALKRPRIAGY
jgi:CheY-like chemotaxis protein